MGYYVILLCAYVTLLKSELIYLHPQIYIISGWWKYSGSFVLAILNYKLFTICGNSPMQLNTVTISFFKFYLFIYSIYMCFAYMFVSILCACLVPVEATREFWIIHYKLSCGFWVSNPGPLEEKPDLLNTESSLRLQDNLFLSNCFTPCEPGILHLCLPLLPRIPEPLFYFQHLRFFFFFLRFHIWVTSCVLSFYIWLISPNIFQF